MLVRYHHRRHHHHHTPLHHKKRGTLLYKWKRDFYPESLYFYWTVRHSELGSFQWFVALLTRLMAHHETDKRVGNIGSQHQVQGLGFSASGLSLCVCGGGVCVG